MSGVYQIPQRLTKGNWAIKIDLAHGMFTTLNVHYFCIIFLVYYGCKEHSFGLSIGGQDSLQNLQQRGTYSDNCSQRIDSIRGDCRIKFVDTSQQRCYRARGQLECETSLADFWHISRPLAIRVGGQVTETPPQTEHNFSYLCLFSTTPSYRLDKQISRSPRLASFQEYCIENIRTLGETRSGYIGNSSPKAGFSLLLGSKKKWSISDRLFHTRLEQIQTSVCVSTSCNDQP